MHVFSFLEEIKWKEILFWRVKMQNKGDRATFLFERVNSSGEIEKSLKWGLFCKYGHNNRKVPPYKW